MEAVHASVEDPSQAICTAAARCAALREDGNWRLDVTTEHTARGGVAGVVADLVLGEQEELTLRGLFVPKAFLKRDPVRCKRCGKADARFKCSKCKRVHYCGMACFKDDWRRVHRKVCGKAAAKPDLPPAPFDDETARALAEMADGSWSPNHEWGVSDETVAAAGVRDLEAMAAKLGEDLQDARRARPTPGAAAPASYFPKAY